MQLTKFLYVDYITEHKTSLNNTKLKKLFVFVLFMFLRMWLGSCDLVEVNSYGKTGTSRGQVDIHKTG